MLDKKLLEILVCPKCKGTLDYDIVGNKLKCYNCKLIFKIEDDIPNMIISDAEEIKWSVKYVEVVIS